MSIIGNILWILLGGLVSAIWWSVAGLILCITIIGIPFGLQCFKIASLVISPFGRDVVCKGMGPFSLIGNIVWILVSGVELAVYHLAFSVILGITIIGIPFAVQHLKLARLSLMPFGAEIS
jgi:uncharacterized membrane protein YccF (DUF307 family)